MSIKVFALTHKQFDVPADKTYEPLHVGRACAKYLGYRGDNTGDNISDKNCYYSELTGVYWIWKNYHDADYVGVCHYRRYLLNEQEKVFTASEMENILKSYDIITSKCLDLNFSYYYGFGENHNIDDLLATEKVIKEKYPEYYETYHRLVHQNHTYFGNIMICKKELFDDYCAWLFDIFSEVEKHVCFDDYDDYHKRVYGFISEFLLYVWVTYHNLSVYESKVGIIGEKCETHEIKKRLVAYLKEKDTEGAKAYFTKAFEKRPDVLMEASDINDELHLIIQAVSTASLEQQLNNGHSILDSIDDYEPLLSYFRKLNAVVNHFRAKEQTPDDIQYLQTSAVSDTAIQISARLFCPTEENCVQTIQAMIETRKTK